MNLETPVRAKRRSERGNWLVVSYHEGKIRFCRWVRTWAGVQMSKRNAERYIWTRKDGSKTGRVIVLNIERMVDFAVCEAANEIHELYQLFEKE